MSSPAQGNPYVHLLHQLQVDGVDYKYFDLTALNDTRYEKLPFSVRVLVESAVRNCDEFQVKKKDVEKILSWEKSQDEETEIPFKPARVLLQDLTGVPVIVDFAAMRDAFKALGGDASLVNPLCPTDLVIDHSVQVDFSRAILKSQELSDLIPAPVKSSPKKTAVPVKQPLCNDCMSQGTCSLAQSLTSLSKGVLPLRNIRNNFESTVAQEVTQNRQSQWYQPDPFPRKLRYENCPFHQQKSFGADSFTKNQELEFERNRERFQFLRWGAKALKNVTIVPPGSGIVHQVNLEYLARVVFASPDENILYPDSLVGADSHTTMINGLGILGWGVGGIEAEAVMLGQATSMVLPQVVGYKLIGKLPSLATSTDVVLTITKHLRQEGVVGKFVEFFGPGVSELSIADRATIANMAPEYGATVGFFPVDEKALKYLAQTGRPDNKIRYIEKYLKAVKLFRNDFNDTNEDPVFTKVLELDLSTITASTSGPKRPQDRVPVSEMKSDFLACLSNKVGFKGYGLAPEKLDTRASLLFEGVEHVLSHGSVVIAAITSCTNTSNPSVMLGAGLLAKKAVEKGLSVAPYIKTSMSPGSGVVTYYLRESGVNVYLEKLGFDVVGYGCMTCIGNSGPLPDPVVEAIEKNDLIAVSVLSGNRNFEGRVHPNTRANYLASPLLVVAYALAGTVAIDFESEPLGHDSSGNEIFLRDIWPSRSEIEQVETQFVIPAMFQEVYSKVTNGNERWNSLEVSGDSLFYSWDVTSSYIKAPPFFDGMTKDLPKLEPITNARVLLNLGDSVTTDHISPAGSISRTSPAAKFLQEAEVQPRDFNSYGARRGHDQVMARGTFANTRLVNKFCSKPGPRTLHIPSGEEMSVFDAAMRYVQEGTPLVILVGKEYGTGSSRDWAAKGPKLLGVRAVIAESYERIHRSNLIGIGIIPLQYLPGENAETLGLTGKELYTIDVPEDICPKQTTTVRTSDGKIFSVTMRFDTEVELQYFLHGGILQFTLRRLLQKQASSPSS